MELTREEAERIMSENDGNLDLHGTEITTLPENLTVGGYLYLSNTGITALPENLTVGGDLYLSGTRITALPENLTVSGSLDLSGTGITTLPENLTVGGSLYLSYTSITDLPENLTVSGSLDLSDTGITTLPENLTVGGRLYLSNTGITTLPENLTVGGWLDLSGTEITALPENLTVGGGLYLSDTRITTLPENLTVGGSLDLRDTGITTLPENLTVGGSLYRDGSGKIKGTPQKLHDGDYVPNRYLYADGILTHIKGKKAIGQYTYYQGKIKGKNVIFDGENYAHCKTIRDGIQDLIFKAAKDRGAAQYKKYSLDSIIDTNEMITMYRVITGACRAGTEAFINSLGKLKDAYTVREAIAMTAGQYHADRFRNFFER